MFISLEGNSIGRIEKFAVSGPEYVQLLAHIPARYLSGSR
ncbi:hypothetical protein CLOSTMETH_02640 [[Clostridium] methylpentosum DSM 5476]|uniref:Uncharacterized protein n=1 Tax=[Clostridium] methylpentosum DSM 5476 TaxID=537013 RepID=C0EFJ8_9FIRM|nr:hypothetical protein CLOSTMETH_02640 [[Clostridium] methylpentosum DSM 5476]